MDEIKFSVIIPTYNRADFIGNAINSVLNQIYSQLELIVVDDGSTDNSKEVINKILKQDSRVKLITLEKNYGRCIARNKGIKTASADWICFLDSDDFYYDNHLQTFADLIIKFPDQYAFATSQIHKGIVGDAFLSGSKSVYNFIKLEDNIKCNPLSVNQLCYNYEKNKVLFPDENIPISEDWIFMRQLTLKSPILKVNIVTNEINEHADRTVNVSPITELARWNYYGAVYFIKNNIVEKKIKSLILSHTLLLCTNMLLSSKMKRESLKYLFKALHFTCSFWNILLFKAIIKYLKP
ncbi:MAG: glycosyltransferase family 2 protein [Bacteroidales bacterium]